MNNNNKNINKNHLDTIDNNICWHMWFSSFRMRFRVISSTIFRIFRYYLLLFTMLSPFYYFTTTEISFSLFLLILKKKERFHKFYRNFNKIFFSFKILFIKIFSFFIYIYKSSHFFLVLHFFSSNCFILFFFCFFRLYLDFILNVLQ